MIYSDWYVLAVLTVFVVLIALTFAPFWQRILVLWIGWFAGGLGIPDALDAKLRRRAAIRSRWGNLGAAVGIALAYLPLRLEDELHGELLLWVVLGAGLLGQCLGVAISSLVLQLTAASDGRRIARTRVVVVHDYVPLRLHVLAWLTWTAGAVATVVACGSGTFPVSSIVIDALAGVGLVLFELSARAIVRRGQPAGSTDELIWDDALRSSTLRDLIQTGVLPVVFGCLAIMDQGSGLHRSHAWIGVAVVLFFTIAEGLVFRRTRSYYLTRLWPTARRRTPSEEAERDAVRTTATAE